MSEVKYPESFPISNVQNIVAAFRGGSINDDIGQFAFDVWVVQGYGQKAVMGSPSIGIQSSSESCDSPCDKGEACCSKETAVDSETVCDVDAQCEMALQALEDSVSDKPNPQMAIPWSIIIPFLLKELMKRIERRQNNPST